MHTHAVEILLRQAKRSRGNFLNQKVANSLIDYKKNYDLHTFQTFASCDIFLSSSFFSQVTMLQPVNSEKAYVRQSSRKEQSAQAFIGGHAP